MDTLQPGAIDSAKLDVLLGRAIADISAGYGGVMISIGNRLGLYKAMAGAGPLTSRELASRTGCAERYVREWLNSQVAGGYVSYHAISNTYELTPEQAFVLADEDSPVFMPNAWSVPASMWADETQGRRSLPHRQRHSLGRSRRAALLRRRGVLSQCLSRQSRAGMAAGARRRRRQAEGRRPRRRHRLRSRPFDRADGAGVPEVAISRLRRASRNPSIEAQNVAARAGVGRRANFVTARADDYPGTGYDLICFFDCLHDMGDPVAAAPARGQGASRATAR